MAEDIGGIVIAPHLEIAVILSQPAVYYLPDLNHPLAQEKPNG